MELSLCSVDGFSENNIVSVRCADTRRQAPISKFRRHALQFPCTIEACPEPIKLDVLEVVASLSLVLRPRETSYNLPFGNSKTIGIHVRDRSEGGHGATPAAVISTPTCTTDIDNHFSGGSSNSQAREYLEKHGLLRYVQALLHAIILSRPEDPFEFMRMQLCAAIPSEGKDIQPTQDPTVVDPSKLSLGQGSVPVEAPAAVAGNLDLTAKRSEMNSNLAELVSSLREEVKELHSQLSAGTDLSTVTAASPLPSHFEPKPPPQKPCDHSERPRPPQGLRSACFASPLAALAMDTRQLLSDSAAVKDKKIPDAESATDAKVHADANAPEVTATRAEVCAAEPCSPVLPSRFHFPAVESPRRAPLPPPQASSGIGLGPQELETPTEEGNECRHASATSGSQRFDRTATSSEEYWNADTSTTAAGGARSAITLVRANTACSETKAGATSDKVVYVQDALGAPASPSARLNHAPDRELLPGRGGPILAPHDHAQVQYFRARFRGLLESAHASGTLRRASDEGVTPVHTAPKSGIDVDVPALRSRLKNTLESALGSGALEETLVSIVALRDSADVGCVRSRLRVALETVHASGGLDELLRTSLTEARCNLRIESHDYTKVQVVRSRLQGTLISMHASGALAEALKSIPRLTACNSATLSSADAAVETPRTRLRVSFEAANASGTLSATLERESVRVRSSSAGASADGADIHAIRSRLRDVLASGQQSGTLAMALKCEEDKEPIPGDRVLIPKVCESVVAEALSENSSGSGKQTSLNTGRQEASRESKTPEQASNEHISHEEEACKITEGEGATLVPSKESGVASTVEGSCEFAPPDDVDEVRALLRNGLVESVASGNLDKLLTAYATDDARAQGPLSASIADEETTALKHQLRDALKSAILNGTMETILPHSGDAMAAVETVLESHEEIQRVRSKLNALSVEHAGLKESIAQMSDQLAALRTENAELVHQFEVHSHEGGLVMSRPLS